METKSYTFMDKSDWPEGEWNQEPDKLQWKDEATGLPCLIRRGPMGALCGYVGVSAGHRLFEKLYSDPAAEELNAHGGLTFSDHCDGDEEKGICHVPGNAEPDHVWWFGFDAAHWQDLVPAMYSETLTKVLGVKFRSVLNGFDTYRNIEYMKKECADLAAQLAAME
jgi:hypothetical protein